jgi:hypothetical protein
MGCLGFASSLRVGPLFSSEGRNPIGSALSKGKQFIEGIACPGLSEFFLKSKLVTGW